MREPGVGTPIAVPPVNAVTAALEVGCYNLQVHGEWHSEKIEYRCVP